MIDQTIDIVTRLRVMAKYCDHGAPNGGGPMGPDPSPKQCKRCSNIAEAATEIERLRNNND